jgi:ribosomal protein S18 acetylase RimI-like enzyme
VGDVAVRRLDSSDRPWLVDTLNEAFAGVIAARRGAAVDASVLPGFCAAVDGRRVGVLTFQIVDGACEVVALACSEEGRGVGQALMNAVRDHAVAAGCRRLWLITTNDNVRAFRFYQLWGMDLRALHRHGVARVRALKPSIPPTGADGIPLEHELEFELLLPPEGDVGGAAEKASPRLSDSVRRLDRADGEPGGGPGFEPSNDVGGVVESEFL